jgi:tRNA dimethylallyltransferase
MKPSLPIIVLTGPTAVGKTAAALRLAEDLESEIISADSRQIYRGMDIGTAKPSPDERRRVRHHLIDIADPDEPFSAGRFRALARPVIETLHRRGRIPVVAGGTGLYIRSLVRGLWEGPPADWTLRERLRGEEARLGPGHLHEKLRGLDPKSAGRIMPGDLAKLVRAIEVYEKTGIPISAQHDRHRLGGDSARAVIVALSRDRAELYRRIERRVDEMMERGFEDEVKGLLAAGYSEDLPAMKGLGYRQIIDYLGGRTDREAAVALIKRETRRYAKRQWTWFNADPSVRWIHLSPGNDGEKVLSEIKTVLRYQDNGEEAVHAEG